MGNVMSLLLSLTDVSPKEPTQVQIQDTDVNCCSTVRESSSESERNIKDDKTLR